VLSATDHWQAVEAASRSRASGKLDAIVLREEPESRNADDEDAPVVEGNGNPGLGQGGVIREVVGSADRFGEPGDGKDAVVRNGKEVGIKLPHSIDAEHKDGSDGAGENIISGMHATGSLNSSSSQVKFIAEDQFVSLCFLGSISYFYCLHSFKS
jgi:hypothetical protein